MPSAAESERLDSPSFGAWRSLVARTVRVGEVPGSNPGAPMLVIDSAFAAGSRWEPPEASAAQLGDLRRAPALAHAADAAGAHQSARGTRFSGIGGQLEGVGEALSLPSS